jgi:hypothetical protein
MISEELLKYIRSSLSQGQKWSDIEKSLQDNSWKDEDISAALAELAKSQTSHPVPKPPSTEINASETVTKTVQTKKQPSQWFTTVFPATVGIACLFYFNHFVTEHTNRLLSSALEPVKYSSLKYPFLVQYFLALYQQPKISWPLLVALPIGLIASIGPVILLFRPHLPSKKIRLLRFLISVIYIGAFLYYFFAIAQKAIDLAAKNFSLPNLISKISLKEYPQEIISDPEKIRQLLTDKTDNKLTFVYPADSFARLAIQDIYTAKSKNVSPFVRSALTPQDYQTTLKPEAFPPVFMINNDKIFLNYLDQPSMIQILPVLALKTISQYFPNRNLKKDRPKIRIVDESTYLKERDQYIDAIIKHNQDIITDDYSLKISVEDTIANFNVAISQQQAEINRIVIARDHEYEQCINEANNFSYLYGYYYEASNSSSYSQCQAQKKYASQAITPYQTAINENKKKLKEQQYLLDSINQEIESKIQYIELINTFDRTTAAYENGLFTSPDSIIIMMESTSSDNFPNLLSTAVHEHLHFLTYSSNNRLLPKPFDEGFTSYFTQQIIKKSYGIDVSGGYDDLMKDINIITAAYPADKLEDIYFKKMYVELYSTIQEKFGAKYDKWLIEFN